MSQWDVQQSTKNTSLLQNSSKPSQICLFKNKNQDLLEDHNLHGDLASGKHEIIWHQNCRQARRDVGGSPVSPLAQNRFSHWIRLGFILLELGTATAMSFLQAPCPWCPTPPWAGCSSIRFLHHYGSLRRVKRDNLLSKNGTILWNSRNLSVGCTIGEKWHCFPLGHHRDRLTH